MKSPEPKAVLVVLMLKIAAYFLIGLGVVLMVFGAVQHSYVRAVAPVLFCGWAATVGLFCTVLGCAFVLPGIVMAVWLRFVEKSWSGEMRINAH